jgi:light-regulated signal transduction histidine kinase (bacteriophytochrome)
MNTNPDAIGDENLRFFGKVVASISHEIKNVMAIINEKAGLLKDLTLMAQKGMALDIHRIQLIADDLQAQIKRGDSIIKNMNKFAHSVDEDIAETNVSEVSGLIATLSERLASRFGVRLTVVPLQPGPVIRTRPILLEQLIWQALQMVMEKCGNEKTVTVEIAKSDPGAQIKFLIDNKAVGASFPVDSVSWLLKILHADLEVLAGGSGLVVHLPLDITVDAV